MDAAQEHDGARVPATRGTEQADRRLLHHPRALLNPTNQQVMARNPGKAWLTGSLPLSARRRADEGDDRELGAPVTDLAQERHKWIRGYPRELVAQGIGWRCFIGVEFLQ